MKFKEISSVRENSLAENINTLQLNIGKMCNLNCYHCHVDAKSKSEDMMTENTMKKVLKLLKMHNFETVDITGGEPSLHSKFVPFLNAISEEVPNIIVRTNLSILDGENKDDAIESLRSVKPNIVGSLPCYTEENTDMMRGKGVFKRSINTLKELNKIGYGIDPDLKLDLVYNPNGSYLPGNQKLLESGYKKELLDKFGVTFNELFTITNIPIGRFKEYLEKNKKYSSYIEMLKENYNESTVSGLMCKRQISVSWNENIYDCDFNQMIDLKVEKYATLDELLKCENLIREIEFGEHCFGCTAGAGSSCGGAIS